MTGVRKPGWAVLAGGLAALGLGLEPGLAASPRSPAPVEEGGGSRRFAIPPQPLTSAVEAFAFATGIQVLYDRPVGPEPRSPGASGDLTPRAALERLLTGTGVTIRFTDDHNVILEPPKIAGAADASPPVGLPSLALDTLTVIGPMVMEMKARPVQDPRFYGGVVQSSVTAALASDPKTASGHYAAGLSLWIAPSGTVQRVGIFQSSGSLERDLAILAVLQRLTLGEHPPPDLPQPINIRVLSRPRR